LRYERAELLYKQNRFQESFQELLKIQMLQPENAQTRDLMDAVKGKIAEGGSAALHTLHGELRLAFVDDTEPRARGSGARGPVSFLR
jgi:hypothetical protein